MSAKALTTARRNLVQRIERYLAELEKRDAAIGQREADHLVLALGHLEGGTFADGERDVMWAEWASRQPGDAEGVPSPAEMPLNSRWRRLGVTPPLSSLTCEGLGVFPP